MITCFESICSNRFTRRTVDPSELSTLDLNETLRQLKAEKEGIEQAIAFLEEFLTGADGDPIHIPKRRGRKSMPPEERRRVSERMKQYWSDRRQGQPDFDKPAH